MTTVKSGFLILISSPGRSVFWHNLLSSSFCMNLEDTGFSNHRGWRQAQKIEQYSCHQQHPAGACTLATPPLRRPPCSRFQSFLDDHGDQGRASVYQSAASDLGKPVLRTPLAFLTFIGTKQFGCSLVRLALYKQPYGFRVRIHYSSTALQ